MLKLDVDLRVRANVKTSAAITINVKIVAMDFLIG